MSHPDPYYDPDNSYEDDDMIPDDYNDFHDGVDGDDRTNEYWPNLATGGDNEDGWNDDIDDYNDGRYDDMDGDFDSGMRDAGFGTDEDYGCFGGEDY